MFVSGMELANGFEELCDAGEQAQRFSVDNQVRAERGQELMPVDQQFLNSLDHLPQCSGVALGFDRLLMLVDDLSSITDAIALLWTEA